MYCLNLLQLSRYTEINPVSANMIVELSDYIWSN